MTNSAADMKGPLFRGLLKAPLLIQYGWKSILKTVASEISAIHPNTPNRNCGFIRR